VRVGRREQSPALLANAVHFASDFGGSLAVLIGLGLVAEGVSGGDSVAALIVAAIVLFAAVRLGRSNVDALMDRAPTGIRGRVERAVRSVPGVSDVRSVRVREAAGESFAEVVIGVPRLEGLERSHRTMDRSMTRCRGAGAGPGGGTRTQRRPASGRTTASRRRPCACPVVETHNITVLQEAGGSAVTLHVRLPRDMPPGRRGGPWTS
jgi:Co/Zn/Cd efflux system component